MNKFLLKNRQIFKWLFLSIMIALPEVIAFAPGKVGVSLITVFLIALLTNIIFTVRGSLKTIRNDQGFILEEKSINKDLKNASIVTLFVALMIGFILIKFIYSPYMSKWWSNWYTKEAMIIWWMAIEGIAIIALIFLTSVLFRKTLTSMIKNINKLVRKTFSLFRKAISSLIALWKMIFDFAQTILEKIILSNKVKNLKYLNDSNIEATILKDQFLVTTKKATWPPLF